MARNPNDPRQWLVEKLADISSIEINTIEAEISARKPPPWPTALLEISETYLSFIDENRDRSSASDLPEINEESNVGMVFRSLIQEAKNGIRPPGTVRQVADDDRRVVFYRIRESCKVVTKILSEKNCDNKSFKDLNEKLPELNVASRILIRKIWELGTNHVVLQTVMQIDGDVVSRIASGRREKDELLLELHQASIGQSIVYWNMVLTLIAQFARGWIGRVFKGG